LLGFNLLNRTFDLEQWRSGSWKFLLDYEGRMPETHPDGIASVFEKAQVLRGEERSYFPELECGDEQALRAEVVGEIDRDREGG